MQLAKLKAATAGQTSAGQARGAKPSANSARVNNQNTTTLPVDSAINRGCQADSAATPIFTGAACVAEPSAKRTASRPAALCLTSRNSEAASTSSNAMDAARRAISTRENDISIRLIVAARL